MSKELYVGHISDNASEEDLRKLFSVMGTVTSVHLIVDPDTGEFKHCGYVRMASGVDLKEVAETLDGALLVDRVITVSIARPQKPGMSKSGRGGKFGGPKAGPGTRGNAPRTVAAKRSGETKGKPDEGAARKSGASYGKKPTPRPAGRRKP
ncbi:RNA-binding protein [Geotalea sp. SG265]|uniref:RNA recognition motif domain-containing protein n=1 Tax=Geotalea sp. SG265 TaxID=2922867 RepID=UPI001FAE99CC|nr:RNA-binding protein [Geotalea sp. SG265]